MPKRLVVAGCVKNARGCDEIFDLGNFFKGLCVVHANHIAGPITDVSVFTISDEFGMERHHAFLDHGDHLKGGLFLEHRCRVGRIDESLDQLDRRGGRGIKRGTSC